MMKEVVHIADLFHGSVYHISSDPDDGTHYDYIVYQDGPDEFHIMPGNSPFNYPQRLNYYGHSELKEESLYTEASKQNCNHWTLVECIRTMQELHDGKYD